MNLMKQPEFEQLPRESAKAHAAFRTYLELGSERSLALTAARLGKCKRLMEKWSRKYDWPGRVAPVNCPMTSPTSKRALPSTPTSRRAASPPWN
jgi:hypothetical protein